MMPKDAHWCTSRATFCEAEVDMAKLNREESEPLAAFDLKQILVTLAPADKMP
jgi:hypothetical protein